MPKLSKNLQEIREEAILYLYRQQYSAQEIGVIFSLTTSAIYQIVKDNEESHK